MPKLWWGYRQSRGMALPEAVDAAALAWMLLLPAVAIAIPTVALLSPSVGALAFPAPSYHYWAGEGIRKASVQVGYVLFVIAAFAYFIAIVAVARRALHLRRRVRGVLVAVAQALGLAFLVLCRIAQPSASPGPVRVYFSLPTLIVSAVLVATVASVARLHARLPRRLATLPVALRLDSTLTGQLCLGAAVLATLVWLLPVVHTDQHLYPQGYFLDAYFFDESAAVLNGRSPLVNMVAYGSLWPYVVAVPLRALSSSYAAFTVIMGSITGIALLAVYGILRRVAGRPVLALGLYLPVLATGFFLEHAIGAELYDPGTYFGMFPLRYAGPYLLAWLTARHIQRRFEQRSSRAVLFAAAGLVALNNFDFGVSALGATLVTVAVVQREWSARAVLRLAVDLLVGLVAALALVSALTLVRAGSLPHLGLLLRYGRIFVAGGFGNLPLPSGLGLHLVVSATFVATGAAAAVRVARRDGDDLLTGMLAWCATFGFGASVYYYAYRSHPDVLVSVFSIWSLALALLATTVLRETWRARRWPSVPGLLVLFGFALAACSIAQVPSPWLQARRIVEGVPAGDVELIPAGGFREASVARLVAARTRAGEPVAILSPVGHRVALEAGVVNVTAYTGLGQMPSREQLDETTATLVREGGSKLFVAEPTLGQFEAELRRSGFARVGAWHVDAWPEASVSEYRVPRR